MTPPSLRSGCVPLRGQTRRLAAVTLSFRALTPSPLRPTASCFGVPLRPKFRVATLLPGWRLDSALSSAQRRCAGRRGAQFPRSPFRSRGPISPRLPAAYGRRAVVGATPLAFFVGYAAKPHLRAARAGALAPSVCGPHPQTAGCVGYAAAPAVWVCRLRVTVWRFPPPLFKLTRLARRPRNNLTAFGWREPPHAEQNQRRAWGRSSVARPPHPQSDPLSLIERVPRLAAAKIPLNKVKVT